LGILYGLHSTTGRATDPTRWINAHADEIPITTPRKRVSHTHVRDIVILYICAHEYTTSEFYTPSELLTHTHSLSLSLTHSLPLSLPSYSLSRSPFSETISTYPPDYHPRVVLPSCRPFFLSGYVIIILRRFIFMYKIHLLTSRDYRRQLKTKSG